MKNVIFDIETDGLLEDTTRIHCLVLKDLDTGERLSCTNDSPIYPDLEEGLEVLSKAERLYGHNILDFDIPAIRKLYPKLPIPGRVMDTLVAVRLRWAHIKELDYEAARRGKLPGHLIGWQSLEAWGYRLGVHKTAYTAWCEKNGIENPWAFWRPEMQSYCEDDVVVNEALITKIRETPGIPLDALEVDLHSTLYLSQQSRNGWPFDFEGAVRLQAHLAGKRQALDQRLKDQFGSWVEPKLHKGEPVVFVPKRNNKTLGYVKGCPATKLEHKEFNAGSTAHIANRLKFMYGWEPTEFTPTGLPKLGDDVLAGLESIPGTEALREYLMIDKRLGQIAEGKEAWLHHMDDTRADGGKLTGMHHIHHRASSTTITHRARHSKPNLGQVPSVESEYGKECRALFRVPDGWSVVGSDASGLEARCLAHYMAAFDGGAYGKILLEGDIHTANMEAIGHGISRYDSKTFFYAYLYGAGDEKLGSIVAPGEAPKKQVALGKSLRRNFEAGIPAMGTLVAAVRGKAERAGYLNLVDGVRAYVRSPHSALNTLLQGTGARICRWWGVEFDKQLSALYGTEPGGSWKDPWAALAWVHDEYQLAVNLKKADPEEVGKILVGSLRGLTERLAFRLPLDGEYMVGANWAETH